MKAGTGGPGPARRAIRRCDAKRRAAGSVRRDDEATRSGGAIGGHSDTQPLRGLSVRPGRTMAAAPRTGRAEPAERRARGTPATGVSAVKLPMTVRQESHRRAVRGDRDGGAEGHLATMPTCQQSGLLVKGEGVKGGQGCDQGFRAPLRAFVPSKAFFPRAAKSAGGVVARVAARISSRCRWPAPARRAGRFRVFQPGGWINAEPLRKRSSL